jgi:hypothetical protein
MLTAIRTKKKGYNDRAVRPCVGILKGLAERSDDGYGANTVYPTSSTGC